MGNQQNLITVYNIRYLLIFSCSIYLTRLSCLRPHLIFRVGPKPLLYLPTSDCYIKDDLSVVLPVVHNTNIFKYALVSLTFSSALPASCIKGVWILHFHQSCICYQANRIIYINTASMMIYWLFQDLTARKSAISYSAGLSFMWSPHSHSYLTLYIICMLHIYICTYIKIIYIIHTNFIYIYKLIL